MKFNHISILAAAIAMAGANANANMLFDIYAGATVGVGGATVFVDDSTTTKMAQSYGAVVGMDIPLARVELEYDYLDHKNANMQLGMVNAYLKMPTPILKPYIGVGVGSTFAGEYEMNSAVKVDIDNTIAYQAMLGLTFDIALLPINIDVEGRALYIPDVFEKWGVEPDVLYYDVRAKVRYVF